MIVSLLYMSNTHRQFLVLFSWRCGHMYDFAFSISAPDVRIGFEQETYTTSEPTGAVQIEQLVCMVIFSGAIGRQLVIAVQWTPGTAQSKNSHVIAASCHVAMQRSHDCLEFICSRSSGIRG